MVRRAVPEAWTDDLGEGTVELLPLAAGAAAAEPGWSTYTTDFDSPEVEVFSGGLNGKLPSAAAVWRQGNLLHFGFSASPAALNDNGKALLVNAVAYVSRFTEDRPIPRTPSVFVAHPAVARARADRVFRHAKPDRGYVEAYFTPSAQQAGNARDLDAFRAWYRKNRDFLRSDEETGKILLDEEARSFGVPPDRPEFFDRAIAALREDGAKGRTARRLLTRYAPDGPRGDADAWRAWWGENRPYLFFSDSGGYRWYIDPLAKKRQVPTADLRGPARATPAR
jgi:hypothetical protein